MQATLLSSQMLLEVDGLLVKTGEVLHGFALPFSDHLYGALKEPRGAVDAIAPRAEGIFQPGTPQRHAALRGLDTPKSRHYPVCVRREFRCYSS